MIERLPEACFIIQHSLYINGSPNTQVYHLYIEIPHGLLWLQKWIQQNSLDTKNLLVLCTFENKF